MKLLTFSLALLLSTYSFGESCYDFYKGDGQKITHPEPSIIELFSSLVGKNKLFSNKNINLGARAVKDSGDFGLSMIEGIELDQRFSNLNNVIGFSRDQDGKIVPLISEKADFQSIRHLPSGPFGDGWNRNRKAKIIPLAIDTTVANAELTTNKHFSDLPVELRRIFEKGHILKTAEADNRTSDWSLLMMTAPSSDGVGGRSGVLLYKGKPVVFRDPGGKEFLLELKGAGSAEAQGGFSKHDDYTFKGGAVARQVVREHESINHFYSKFGGDGVLSLGYATFRTNLGHQGILFRLTPGTTRMTFQENSTFGNLNPKEGIENFGRIWGSYFSEGFIAMSHAENVVVSANGKQFFPTDLSDLLPSNRFPVRWGHRDVSLAEALKRSLNAVTEIEGYSTDGIVFLKAGLKKSFLLRSEQQDRFEDLKNIDEIADFILKEVVYPKLAGQINESWNDSVVKKLSEFRSALPKSESYLDFSLNNLRMYRSRLLGDDKPDHPMIRFLDTITKDKDSLLKYLNKINEAAYRPQYSLFFQRLYLYMRTSDVLVIKSILLERLNELYLILNAGDTGKPDQLAKLALAKDLLERLKQMNDVEFLIFIEKHSFQDILNLNMAAVF